MWRIYTSPKANWIKLFKNEAQSHFHGFSVLFVSSAPHVLGILILALALCSVWFIKAYVLCSHAIFSWAQCLFAAAFIMFWAYEYAHGLGVRFGS